MKIFTSPDITDNTAATAPCVATIGFFDGVHRGHKFLIGNVIDAAARSGLRSMVITFDSHPRLVLHKDYRPRLLTTAGEKAARLRATGVDYVAMLHFDEAMARLSAYDFMKDVLRDRLNVRTLVTGYDNRFGHNRSEGFDDYVGYGRELGIEVLPARAYSLPSLPDGRPISSSLIRQLLQGGEVTLAGQCLGYHYFLNGTVVSGHGVGHRLGYPTANLQVDYPSKIIPANGVYAVQVEMNGNRHNGMLNIGCRPTLNNGNDRSIEVYIFDFKEDIYNCPLRLSFVQRVRGEQKFASVDALKAQLQQDEAEIRELLHDSDT